MRPPWARSLKHAGTRFRNIVSSFLMGFRNQQFPNILLSECSYMQLTARRTFYLHTHLNINFIIKIKLGSWWCLALVKSVPRQSCKVTVARGSDLARFGPIFFRLLWTGSAWILPTQYRKVCINGQSMELLQCFSILCWAQVMELPSINLVSQHWKWVYAVYVMTVCMSRCSPNSMTRFQIVRYKASDQE